MEILVTSISFGLLIGIIISPFLILLALNKLKVKHKLIAFLTLGVIITSIMTLTFAWWADTSDRILLLHYGYDFDAMNDAERYANVSAESMERVKSLEISVTGIGWPLKALMTYAIYAPYLLIVYVISYLITKYKRKQSAHD